MTVLRACIDCGAPFSPSTPRTIRCPQHQGTGTGWSHNRNRKAQATFRVAVLARDGYHCTTVENGERCTVRTDLRACHIIPLAAGGSFDPANGITRCRTHDMATDQWAR